MDDALDRLLDQHGQTYAAEAGISLSDKPAPLFQLLVLTSLLSANLSAELGVRACEGLRRRFRTVASMAEANEEEIWEVLSETRYLRKEQTAAQLRELAEQAVARYDGDLRRLRDDADGEVDRIRQALRAFTGIGPTGADIFLREVQAVWTVVRPFADARVGEAARRLGLPHTASGLVGRLGSEDLSSVGAAVVRTDLAGEG